ncbi:MAG: methionine--tRNA ligase [Candidatus Nanopelagicales bacterium]
MAAYYVTTPIYYVNDAPHIGHAYTTTAGDVLTRWHRQRGESVWYQTGVDEHGTKVQRAAEVAGVSPQEWCDRLVSQAWIPVLDTIDAANDGFIRTTQEQHRLGVQRFWEVVRDNGYVYQADYEGPYCVGCEEFKLPGDVVTTDNGTIMCPVHDRPVEMLSEANWFFQLSAFTEALISHYENDPSAIEPVSAYNEVMSFLRQGLRDISMSRSSVTWGIGLPWDEKQVTYVWFDALLNYITAIGYGTEPGSEQAMEFERIWPADVHLVGKDILRFHAVYWPAMLMAAGLALPRKVFAHGWLLVGGEKMSKTRLTGIAPEFIVDHFGSDAFRYYFMRAINFGHDGSFSWEDMNARYTSELANGLGNLASRGTAMVERYRNGVLPAAGPPTDAETHLQTLLLSTVERCDERMLALDFAEGIAAIREYVEAVNLYVTEQQPWALAKDDAQAERLNSVLYTIIESLRAICVLYFPVMPKAMAALWQSLGAHAALGEIADQRIQSTAQWGQMPAGTVVSKGENLFPRLADADVQS